MGGEELRRQVPIGLIARTGRKKKSGYRLWLPVEEVKVRRPSPAHQDNSVFASGGHGPGMIQLTRDHHVTAHRQLMVFLAEANSQLARHHHHILIMAMPVQIEMGTGWKQGIVGDALGNRVDANAVGLDADGKAVAATGRGPLQILQMNSKWIYIRG